MSTHARMAMPHPLCGKPNRAGGFCKRPAPCAYHTPGRAVPRPPRRSLADRLYEKCIPEPMSGCWLWTGFAPADGYGRIKRPGRGGDVVLAHRVSYELSVGPIPDGLDVLHSCDNPACINPRHLHPGTEQDNMREMVARGRNKTQRGDAHPFRREREKYLPLMRENARRAFARG